MTSPLSQLEPKYLWNHFDQIRQVPRPSKHEEKIIAHVKKWAEERNFEVKQDAVGNLCVRVPATPGHENAPTVIIQGHLDMVPEKDDTVPDFDFEKDPIDCKVDGDWVVAEHTTLGADNGIGLATAMASADDPSVVHGPLELLFTVDEETGLTGASGLDASILTGKILLNLDSEEDGVLFVGCAGGATSEIDFAMDRKPVPSDYTSVKLTVSGLVGGHSGLNIIENRANAIKLAARVLYQWLQAGDVLIDSFEGGSKHNAIPRDTTVLAWIPKAFVEQAKKLANEQLEGARSEYRTIDPDISLTVEEATANDKPASAEASKRFIQMLIAIPDGVSAMSRDIAGLVETSSNLAIVTTKGDEWAVTASSRSSVDAALRNVLDECQAVVELAGGAYREEGAYAAWQPNMDSKILGVCKDVFKKMYDKEPSVEAIHAGLECGIIGEKIGKQADMISYGPQLSGVHAPGEKAQISSVARFWDFHKKVLETLA